ncbi:MAG: enoyl-CoA hydratase-related protein [Lysobacterales bacterium]
MTTEYTARDKVAVLTLNNPPVNGLGFDTRTALAAGLDRALADPAIDAIVINGAGKSFCGGADIKEFGTPAALAEPNLLSLILAVEQSTKPVVIAVHGVCMGGGLELALGCHYRIAAPGTQVALPEVKIGLVPGAGGTQRLPRAIGLEPAMNMIVSGNPVASELLAAIPGQRLFDQIVDGDLLDAAIAFARSKVGAPLPRLRDLRVKHDNAEAFIAFARLTVGAMAKDYPAPQRCVDCVEAAARKRFDEGIKIEREAFAALMMTPESRALRHAFFGERAAAKIPDVPESTPTREVSKVGVIGAGTMGGGIAMNFLNAGLPVVILETAQEALDRGIATLTRNYESSLASWQAHARQAGEATESADADVADHARRWLIGDLIIEAVYEEIGVKEKVFKQLMRWPSAVVIPCQQHLDAECRR